MGLIGKKDGENSDDLSFKDTPIEVSKDKAPKSNGGKPAAAAGKKAAPGKASSTELKKIEDALAELLSAPAMAFDLRGDEWPADHVRNQAPEFAKRITKIAEIKPEFRAQLLKMIDGGVWGPLVFAGIMYVLPLGVYYELVPLPMPARMALAGGTPTRGEVLDVEDEGEGATGE